MSVTTFFLITALVWIATGLIVSVMMARRGHDPFPWWLLGASFGPLILPVALEHRRAQPGPQPEVVRTGVAGPGIVDVLVGIDGSAESLGAVRIAAELLGDRLRRLTLATVLTHEAVTSGHVDRAKDEALRLLEAAALEVTGLRTGIEVLVGEPARELTARAIGDGYALVAVGRRGRGASKALVGSTASRLTHMGRVPVLIVANAYRSRADTGRI